MCHVCAWKSKAVIKFPKGRVTWKIPRCLRSHFLLAYRGIVFSRLFWCYYAGLLTFIWLRECGWFWCTSLSRCIMTFVKFSVYMSLLSLFLAKVMERQEDYRNSSLSIDIIKIVVFEVVMHNDNCHCISRGGTPEYPH